MPLYQATRDRIVSFLNKSKEERQSETMKFDFKAKWYNLREKTALSEFLKDTSAIANTFGPDGYLVIGYDDTIKEFIPSSFTDSGYKNTSDINFLIASNVDPLFHLDIIDDEIEGNNVTVIHILPSLAKPHVINKYHTIDKQGNPRTENNRIFVRNTTATVHASRYDLELMYYDRKNIIPEYQLFTSLDLDDLTLGHYSEDKPYLIDASVMLDFIIENTGRRPVAIREVNFNLIYPPLYKEEPLLSMKSDLLHQFSPTMLPTPTIVVQSGQLMRSQIIFKGKTRIAFPAYGPGQKLEEAFQNIGQLIISPLIFTLSNNEKVVSEPTVVK